MAWDFSTDSELQRKLDWMDRFIREEIFPLEVADLGVDAFKTVVEDLQQQVRAQGLWAMHLPPELGGGGAGQVTMGLMQELQGMSPLAPMIFGNNAPDSGNAELLAAGATEEQKERWLYPLLRGELRSSFSMTEPGAGSDPTMLKTRAVTEGDGYILTGHKWFSSNAFSADFLVVMAVTDPDAEPHKRATMFVVPTDTPGVELVRNIPVMGGSREPGPFDELYSGPGEVKYHGVRLTRANRIGDEGQGFALAQTRLGAGRIHHAMRWIGQGRRAFDMMAERALSRETKGSVLAEKQLVQDMIATSAAELEAARLLTLQAAWKIDQSGTKAAMVDISLIKFFGASVLYNVIDRAIQVHGAMGLSADLPLERMYRDARAARIVDGPDEVHKSTVTRRLLRHYTAVDGLPSEHIPTRREAAQRKFAALLETASANQ